MKFRKPQIELRTSPHVRGADDVVIIMRNVVLALLPIAAWSVWLFGLSALVLIVTVTLSCMLTERFFDWMGGRENTLGDWSAAITGLLMALTLPPGFPLWMGVVAAVSGIGLGKALFGGLGMNVMNPALIGRAFVQAAFPVSITTWTPAYFDGRFTSFIPTTLTPPFMIPPSIGEWVEGVRVDAFSGATPLAVQKFDGVQAPLMDMFMGVSSGSVGETSAFLILICGLYLAVRKFMDWRIPVYVMLGAVLTALPFYLLDAAKYPDPIFVLASGGLMLGAWFMASDMVGSPLTPKGILIYGLMIGFLTVMIRLFGGLTEGVMYAILFGNAMVPLIDKYTQPRTFGGGPKSQQGRKAS